jgi:hypothetical protein
MTHKWLLSCTASTLTLTLANVITQFAPGHLGMRPGGARFFALGARQTMPTGEKTFAAGHRMRSTK